ncbi:hypothetical protein MTO96_035889 [Rhipicephalus appendiculatus]
MRIGNSVCRDTTRTTASAAVCAMRAGPTRISPSAMTSMSSLFKSAPPRTSHAHTGLAIQIGTRSESAFRERGLHSAASNIEDLSTWTDQLLAYLEAVTTSIPTKKDHPTIDSRLAHLWAASTGLTNRWHKQHYNCHCRLRC